MPCFFAEVFVSVVVGFSLFEIWLLFLWINAQAAFQRKTIINSFFVCQLKVVNLFFKIFPRKFFSSHQKWLKRRKKIAEAVSLGLFVAQFRGTPFWTNGDHKLWACPRLTTFASEKRSHHTFGHCHRLIFTCCRFLTIYFYRQHLDYQKSLEPLIILFELWPN